MLSRLVTQRVVQCSHSVARPVFGQLARPLGSSSGGHGNEEPHISKPHYYASKFLLVCTYLWIFWRFKEDKGQLLGLYEPWKHPHEHHDPMYKFSVNEKGDTVAVDVETGEPLGDNE